MLLEVKSIMRIFNRLLQALKQVPKKSTRGNIFWYMQWRTIVDIISIF